MERRTLQTHRPQLIRSTDGKPTKIAGYAAVFYNADDPGTEYELCRYGSYRLVERLMPGCFDRAIREDDVRALFNHNADAILGRLRSGTLKLYSDTKGLRYEIDPPDTTFGRDLLESLKRGDVSGSSFCFDYVTRSNIDQRLSDGTDQEIIQVIEAKLFDVGPVTFPAYSSTTAEARAQQRKAKGNGVRLTPEAALRHVEKMDQELAALDRRIAKNASCTSRRWRRDRIRDRANQIVAEAEHRAAIQVVEDARRQHLAGLARRKL